MIFLLIVLRLNLKQKTTDKTITGGSKDFETVMPLKYLSNFWELLK